MSKIGKQPIQIPEGATLGITTGSVMVKGPKGELTVPVPRGINVRKEKNTIFVDRDKDTTELKSLHGLTRSLIQNALIGVTKEFTKTLEIKGVGYRASLKGDILVLTVGYSHLVEVKKPRGVTFSVKGTKITVSGIDKQQVGDVAARIRRIRPPDAYKGKGIRYSGEMIKLKPGKAAKTTGTV